MKFATVALIACTPSWRRPLRSGVCALALLALAPAGAQPTGGSPPRPAQGAATGSIDADLQMQQRSAAFRAVADEFVATAVSGDGGKLERMISPNLAGRAGVEVVRRNLQQQVVPFFSDHASIGRSVTIANTTDSFGSTGFVYYMYSVPRTGEQRPFSIYIVEENGRKVVGNILVNRLVPGRHQ